MPNLSWSDIKDFERLQEYLISKGVAFAFLKYTATNYTDLTTNVAPTANEGELAIVYNSQGVWLVNRKLKGVYIYQSGIWEYANQELQDILAAKLDSVVGGSGVTIDNTDPLNPIINASAGANEVIEQESDFPTPVGGVITLDPTKTYVVYGNVVITNKIDVNGASLVGTSRLHDKITSTQASSSIFTGNGNIVSRELTFSITGAGSKLFDITGSTGFEYIDIDTCTFSGNTDLGGIDTQYAVQIRNTSITGNAGSGLTITDGGRVSIKDTDFSQFNSSTNQLTLLGDYELIQISGGGMGVAGGNTGLNVSGITSVNLYGQITNYSFVGAGTYVDDLTVFEDVVWEVEAYGVSFIYKDIEAECNIYLNTPTVTVISGANTPTKVLGATTQGQCFRCDDDGGTNNRVKYIGTHTRTFTVNATVSLDTTGLFGGDLVSIYIYKNGVQVPESRAESELGGFVGIQAIPVNCSVELSTNDYIELWVENNDGAGNIDIRRFNLSVS